MTPEKKQQQQDEADDADDDDDECKADKDTHATIIFVL